MSDVATQAQWERRADAVGKAQSRYLWVGLIAGLFFFALQHSPSPSRTVRVPFLDLTLAADAVLAAGGPALAFILLVILGSLRGWGDTMKKAFGPDWDKHTEAFDMHPTAFDLAHVTTREWPLVDKIATFLFYPTFVGLLLYESASLLAWLAVTAAPGRAVFLPLGVILWLWASLHVGAFWWSRIRRVFGLSAA